MIRKAGRLLQAASLQMQRHVWNDSPRSLGLLFSRLLMRDLFFTKQIFVSDCASRHIAPRVLSERLFFKSRIPGTGRTSSEIGSSLHALENAHLVCKTGSKLGQMTQGSGRERRLVLKQG
ncbi:hypothetical protein [Edaphobacter aggregans]|uniref:hypothetical protein n=1 Tax=Edaphobacter aggregans TaxID=570835 RepID=UPI000F74BAB6|nr:hypothetical protein [Edaphobacter aggregans]